MISRSQRLRRADLHVHTSHSIEYLAYGPFKAAWSLAVEPATIARRAFEAGMDYVAITDHDTIDGALELLEARPDLAPRVIVGEEVTTRAPESGAEIHVAVYDIDEPQHREIQRLRGDLLELLAYLRAEGVLYALNHPIWDAECSTWDVRRLLETIRLIRDHFPVIEGINGALLSRNNRLGQRIARHFDRYVIGGSDSHSGQVGYAYTEAPGDTPREFLDAIRRGESRAAGRSATTGHLGAEVGGVISSAVRPRHAPASRMTRIGLDFLAAFHDIVERRLVQLVVDRYVAAQRSCVPESVHALAMGLTCDSRGADISDVRDAGVAGSVLAEPVVAL